MNYSVAALEMWVVALGLGLLLLDLFVPAERRRGLGYLAVGALAVLFIGSCVGLNQGDPTTTAYGGLFVQDALAIYFKRFFLLAAFLVMLMAVEFSDRFEGGATEYYSLIVFALAGMLFAASANNFALLFVALELITVTFYVLTSFQRGKVASLEAGVKYLILGALSSAFLIYGIALVYGTTGTMQFDVLAAKLAAGQELAHKPILVLGLLLVLSGLGFKIAAFPFQIWAPDVYQGSPAPTTAFLAVGSKAAGIVLLLRVLFIGAPEIALHWNKLLIVIAAITILYGSLCAIPQRNLKRLFGYSSIANAGFLLLGFSTLSQPGSVGVLYYLSGYLFTVLAAFTVITVVIHETGSEEISGLAGLGRRSPLLATGLTLAMASLAGIPPLAGFFGKFLLFKAVVEQGIHHRAYFGLLAVAIFGVAVSIYYYFGIVRAIYWSRETDDTVSITPSVSASVGIYVGMAGIVFLGLFPSYPLELITQAVAVLKF